MTAVEQPSLYERLGGEAGIARVVDTFYDMVLSDPRVAPFFANTDMAKQRRHQTLFLTFATGGPNKYTGRGLREAHRGLGIRNEHFDIIIELLCRALRQHGVAETDIAAVVARLEATRPEIVE